MATVTLFLCCLLGSVSLVYGQAALIRLAASNEPPGTDHTGEIISFFDVGPGVGTDSSAWYCYTSDPSGASWQFPDGTNLPIGVPNDPNTAAVDEELFITGAQFTAVALHRGPTHFSPDGEHCCVRLNTNERRCVTFTPCPTLSPLSNGTISYNATNNMATYTCDTGYTISGATPITCMSDDTSAGTWSPTPSSICTIVTCPVLTPPTNGGVSTTNLNYQGVAAYSCDTGYVRTGSAFRHCQATGIWSGVAPICPPVDCGSLTDPSNGAVDTSSGTTYPKRSTYTCNPGYTLTGDMTITCQVNGMWSSSEPACEFIVLFIGGTVYTNNTALSFSLIGEGFSALTCHTELSTCCREQDNPNGGALIGGWRGPDGNSIPAASDTCPSEGFYIIRGISTISLNRCSNESLVGGVYCCTIPRASGIIQTFCVNLQFSATTEPASTCTDGPTVALGVLLTGSVVGNIVFITLLIIKKRKRTQARSQLSCTYSNKQEPVYEVPSKVEGVNKLGVGGPPTAIELRECPAYGIH